MSDLKEEKERKKESKQRTGNELVTKESVGAVGAIFSLFALLILLTGTKIFGDVGYAVKSFLLGVGGFYSYLALPVIFLLSASAFVGKSPLKNKAVRRVFWFISVSFLLVHAIVTYSWVEKGYLTACFKNAGKGIRFATPAGWLGAIPVFLLKKATGGVGTIVILSLIALIFALACFKAFTGKLPFPSVKKREKKQPEPAAVAVEEPTPAPAPAQETIFAPTPPQSEPPVRPAYVPVTPEVRQRPGVLLSDEGYGKTESVQNAFSPFGYGMTAREGKKPEKEYANEREFLFGGDPAENYRKNLIFDENDSRVITGGTKGVEVNYRRADCANIVKYALKRGEYELTSFEPYSVRYTRLAVTKGRVRVRSFGFNPYENPSAYA